MIKIEALALEFVTQKPYGLVICILLGLMSIVRANTLLMWFEQEVVSRDEVHQTFLPRHLSSHLHSTL
jgi:hypothetical protein